jgi:DNA-binding XRE family transcriptional regulator
MNFGHKLGTTFYEDKYCFGSNPGTPLARGWHTGRGLNLIGVRPSVIEIPKIIEFLGRDPFERKAEALGDRIRDYRRTHGLSQKSLVKLLEIDTSSIANLERGLHQPTKRIRDNLTSQDALLWSFPPPSL